MKGRSGRKNICEAAGKAGRNLRVGLRSFFIRQCGDTAPGEAPAPVPVFPRIVEIRTSRECYRVKQSAPRSSGCILVEVMIVVGIIGVLAAIATPGFVRARAASNRAAL
jgi:hypothetical protein